MAFSTLARRFMPYLACLKRLLVIFLRYQKLYSCGFQNAAKGYSAGRFSLLSWPASIVNAGNVGDISARWLFWVYSN